MILLLLLAPYLFAQDDNQPIITNENLAYLALIIFILALFFTLIIIKSKIRKSSLILLSAGIIWLIVAIVYQNLDQIYQIKSTLNQNFILYANVLLFVLVVMIYINALENRNLFIYLAYRMSKLNLNYRQAFILLNISAFLLSFCVDNLSLILIYASLVIKIEPDESFINLSTLSLLVSIICGSILSPIGDLTNLILVHENKLNLYDFNDSVIAVLLYYGLFLSIITFKIKTKKITPISDKPVLKSGAIYILVLFITSIFTAISFADEFKLSLTIGMMMSLGFLQFYSFYLSHITTPNKRNFFKIFKLNLKSNKAPFDVFKGISQHNWDALIFLYGILMCISGLKLLGWFNLEFKTWYLELKAEYLIALIAFLSAFIENLILIFGLLSLDIGTHDWQMHILNIHLASIFTPFGSIPGIILYSFAFKYYNLKLHFKFMPLFIFCYLSSMSYYLYF